MKTILRILFHPVLLALVGLAALAGVIWFFGPLLAFAEWHPLDAQWTRITLIIVIVLLYGGKKVWVALNSKRTDARMMNGLLRPAPNVPSEPSASQQELATLRNRFEEALGKLKQAPLGAQGRKKGLAALLSPRQYLYQLPWYIFIGAPGSGKTTALINAGLRFPLAETGGPGPVRGIGGTRNCDWWFTDEALLLDTAGRYTTHESNREVDAAGWQGFLQLLKKHRRRRPINGVILTVSVADLVRQSAAQRETHAGALRARLNELHEQLGIRFPVYVLVTKCDLLGGFMEFFGEFGKEERTQVWGISFPFSEDPHSPSLGSFGAEFALLESRLNDRLIDRMQQERDPARRALIYAFPQQFGALKELLGGFLDEVFVASRFHFPPLLRGVYFTSGTQEGNPIDRVMGALARTFGLERKIMPPQAASGRSYFLTRLLKEVIFAEQDLASTNLKWERRRALIQWSAYGLTALVVVALIAGWTVSYRNNRAYIAQVETKLATTVKKVEGLPTGASTDILGLLPVLQSVKELAAASGVAEGEAPLSMSFGLFQGNKLASATDNAYRRLLQGTFLRGLLYRMEEQLRSAERDNRELLYEGLKTYLMFHHPEHFDAAVVKAWVSADWERTLPRDTGVEVRDQLEAHFDALFERGAQTAPIPPDQALVQQARAQLATLGLPQRVYSRLKRQRVGSDVPEFRVAQAAGPSAALVFERASGQPLTSGVPGLFTYNGYHKAFLKEAEKVAQQLADEEPWVLGIAERQQSTLTDPRAAQRVTGQVRRLYLEDYARTWEKMIADIQLIRPRSLQQSVQMARILSAPDSPLPLLLRALVRETTLGEKQEGEKTVVDRAGDRVKGAQEELRKILGGTAPQTASIPDARLESIVDDRFDGLRRFARAPAPGQPAPLDTALALINELYTLLTATESAVKGGMGPPQSDVPNKVKAEAGRMPEPMRSLLQTLLSTGTSLALGATRSNLSANLAAAIGDFCPKAINNRYPFSPRSALDVTQEDFARLFSPGGLLDEFFQKNLSQYVDRSGRVWTFKPTGGASMGDSGTLVQFQRAAVIRDVFFQGGAKTASLRLDFKPLEMDAGITLFILDVDGQLVKYSHGPQVRQSVQWPGPRGSTQVRLQVSPAPAAGAAGMLFEGPWALFRLFDRAQIISTGQPERFRVSFTVDQRKALFEVTATSVQNPFRLKEIEQFQCPNRL